MKELQKKNNKKLITGFTYTCILRPYLYLYIYFFLNLIRDCFLNILFSREQIQYSIIFFILFFIYFFCCLEYIRQRFDDFEYILCLRLLQILHRKITFSFLYLHVFIFLFPTTVFYFHFHLFRINFFFLSISIFNFFSFVNTNQLTNTILRNVYFYSYHKFRIKFL